MYMFSLSQSVSLIISFFLFFSYEILQCEWESFELEDSWLRFARKLVATTKKKKAALVSSRVRANFPLSKVFLMQRLLRSWDEGERRRRRPTDEEKRIIKLFFFASCPFLVLQSTPSYQHKKKQKKQLETKKTQQNVRRFSFLRRSTTIKCEPSCNVPWHRLTKTKWGKIMFEKVAKRQKCIFQFLGERDGQFLSVGHISDLAFLSWWSDQSK
jgi:hypothetical protein